MRTVVSLAQDKFSHRLLKTTDVDFADFCGQPKERHF
jgi:hypothetical protein